MKQSARSNRSGVWAVIVILTLGVVLGLVGLKFRRFPEDERETTPATMATHVGGEQGH
jgi:hypothetical protein